MVVFERTHGDKVGLPPSTVRVADDAGEVVGGGGARFSFWSSFKWEVPLIILELNTGGDGYADRGSTSIGTVLDVVIALDEADADVDVLSSSSASSHKFTLAKVEQSFCRSKEKQFNASGYNDVHKKRKIFPAPAENRPDEKWVSLHVESA